MLDFLIGAIGAAIAIGICFIVNAIIETARESRYHQHREKDEYERAVEQTWYELLNAIKGGKNGR
jgi:hypothetical protein